MAPTPPTPSGGEGTPDAPEPPLASSEPEDDGADAPDDSPEPADAPAGRPPPPPIQFKPMTSLLVFMFLLGFLMILPIPLGYSLKYGIAGSVLNPLLFPVIGFSGQFPLLTMAIAASVEMLATALAYNWATDWVKAARAQKWGSAFRKVQMAALRSGKKDRIAALAPHQAKLNQLSAEVSLAQMKGMAVTWFLLISIYSWVYVFLYGCLVAAGAKGYCTVAPATVHTILVAGSRINLTDPTGLSSYTWFVLFALYTVPVSLLFRRILKHWTLRQYAERLDHAPDAPRASGGGA